MSFNTSELIEQLRVKDEIFFLRSQATNRPLVICDDETANDQVWLFANEEEMKAYAGDIIQKKNLPFAGMKIVKAGLPEFYLQLHAMGVNTIMWNEGGEKIEIDLEQIAPYTNLKNDPNSKMPPINPSLHLSCIYYMQEIRRPHPEGGLNIETVRELEEEAMVNIMRCPLYVVLGCNPENEKEMGPMVMNIKDKGSVLPIFSDLVEVRQFLGQFAASMRSTKLTTLKMEDLIKITPKETMGFVLNPTGLNMLVSKKKLGLE